jgi:hypothetical protein
MRPTCDLSNPHRYIQTVAVHFSKAPSPVHTFLAEPGAHLSALAVCEPVS